MGFTDKQIGWKLKEVWIPIAQFAGFDINTSMLSLGQGATTLEPGGDGSAAEIATVPMTTADEVHHILPLPYDMDTAYNLQASVWFMHDSTDAGDAPVFKIRHKWLGPQAAVLKVGDGDTVDATTSITADATSATDQSLERTPFQSLGTAVTFAATDVALQLGLELDALGGAAADECEIIGLMLRYAVKACADQSDGHQYT